MTAPSVGGFVSVEDKATTEFDLVSAPCTPAARYPTQPRASNSDQVGEAHVQHEQ